MLLLIIDPSTIPSKIVQELIDVFNGENVDWNFFLYESIRVELLTMHQVLFKEETTVIKTMVGPHVVIFLGVQEHLILQQEGKPRIWDPFRAFEKEEPQQKRIKQETLRGPNQYNEYKIPRHKNKTIVNDSKLFI